MIIGFDRDDLARNLPDVYRKDAESNNAKLLAIEKGETDTMRAELEAVDDSLDINRATGSTLDLYGAMIGQERGAATDEQYRTLIRAKILRNLAGTDYNSIVYAIASALDGASATDIVLVEETPCTVRVDALPYSVLNGSNIDLPTAMAIIRRLMPAGVRLESVGFSGTFEFGTEATDYDADAGFGDVEQTIGGYFGLIADGADSNLPV